MEILCELGTEEKSVSRGPHAGKTIREKLLVGACKYSWTLAKQSEGYQPIGQKHYSGFKYMLPSIYHYFDVDSSRLVKIVVESLVNHLPRVDREDREALETALETAVIELHENRGDIESLLRDIGKSLDELHHANFNVWSYEEESGNVYKRLKSS